MSVRSFDFAQDDRSGPSTPLRDRRRQLGSPVKRVGGGAEDVGGGGGVDYGLDI